MSVCLPIVQKAKEGEAKEEKGLWYMGLWDVGRCTAGGTIIVAGTAAMLLSAVPLPLSARSVSQFVSACLCDEPS